MDLVEGRPKLSILNYCIGENSSPPNDRSSRHFAGYLFDQLTAGPINIGIYGTHFLIISHCRFSAS